MNPRTVLLLVLVSLVSSQAHQCRSDQALALLQLKNDFSSMSSLSPAWIPDTNCCNWDGVICDAASGVVVSLDLSNHNISGEINSSLFELTSLQRLNLANNAFYGSPLPPLGFEKLGDLTYLNLSNSGFAGRVPIGISRLKKLVSLDLSTYLFDGGELDTPDLGALIGGLSNLQKLYLDGVNLSSNSMDWCQVIAKSAPGLQALSLSGCSLSGPIHESLSKLQNLSVIHLDLNTLSCEVPEFFGNFSHLNELSLIDCELYGLFPYSVFLLRNLKALDLSLNPMLSGYLPEFPRESALEELILENTNFTGSLPESLGNLKSLTKLGLASCHFSGPIPLSIAKLNQLVHLDLSLNGFSGKIPPQVGGERISQIILSHNSFTGGIPQSFGRLQSLTNLDLRNNSLNGSIPVTLFTLLALQVLHLNLNKLSGELEEFYNTSSSLETVNLSDNELQGDIPRSITELSNLKYLALASNNFSGTLELDLIGRMKNLFHLDLSSNKLSISNASGNSSLLFPSITTLKLVSCNLVMIPPFLEHKLHMTDLDLSNNQIGGAIPKWIWNIGNSTLSYWNLPYNSLSYLNLSYNLFTYVDGPLPNVSMSHSSMILDLHSNLLRGPVPLPPPNTIILDYSNNFFTSFIPSNISSYLSGTLFFSLSNNRLIGNIPPSICDAPYLQILDLSDNSFSGSIPECLLREVSVLQVLNLKGNQLQGLLPMNVSSQCSLRTLNLNDNKLEGQLPRSLANCGSIEVLDLGHNKFVDSFPHWLGNMSALKALVLRSNEFHGRLGHPLGGNYTFPKLQIFDISSNNFSGHLPHEFFENLKAMMIDPNLSDLTIGVAYLQFDSSDRYQNSITVTFKGLVLTFVKALGILRSIDFSNNRFEGSLPKSLGNLTSLVMLNISRNNFTGPIPAELGKLVQLEALDLSCNQFSEEIPESLVFLHFLSFLDLSNNKLVGRIPLDSQFSTFSNTSFEGNTGLCGSPLSKQCADSSPPSPTFLFSESDHEPNWLFIFVELGFIVGFSHSVLDL
ncbi:receptor-like protein 7 [Dioscorea cayenensis subsp. rotundata]|uniref:Receptor-like protein 7 n=1 Tax=Dioscorea cayennensis subsp. rotundata TaxID=55577 RepID=A0AB40CBZ1_DIOCR|nr:receptor-like protein 7 [Dioscorea cayenensis subsp. rotundata]